jgi:predicted Rossmann-fold nucleotide-binding protein
MVSAITGETKKALVMVEHSDAFIILPGGAGTLQELLALFLLLREQGNPLMIYKGAPNQFKNIILVNSPLEGTRMGFYDSIIKLIEAFDYQEGKEFHVVKDEAEAMEKLQVLQKGRETEKLAGNWSTNRHYPITNPFLPIKD